GGVRPEHEIESPKGKYDGVEETIGHGYGDTRLVAGEPTGAELEVSEAEEHGAQHQLPHHDKEDAGPAHAGKPRGEAGARQDDDEHKQCNRRETDLNSRERGERARPACIDDLEEGPEGQGACGGSREE